MEIKYDIRNNYLKYYNEIYGIKTQQRSYGKFY